jgi:hypothetical protein
MEIALRFRLRRNHPTDEELNAIAPVDDCEDDDEEALIDRLPLEKAQ